jgi:hypothetical protein
MIKQVLQAINSMGVISENEIAEAAKTSPAMVQQASLYCSKRLPYLY